MANRTFKKFDFGKLRHQIFITKEVQDEGRKSAAKKFSSQTKRYWANQRINERNRQARVPTRFTDS
jgi:hypothetical protein